MEKKIIDNNARRALKQVKLEIASEYGVDRDFVLDALENAATGGVLEGYFGKLPSVNNDNKTNGKLRE
ncbi:CD1290 family small acid-soluble spore protein [Metaclostridioides mangenotii]|uniref:CD1290 family small acid-soluble spore protein n=1 Tax=Metaclostridioides mangenotii TaxID=1540 RepID=UPI0004B9FF62|nr:CD1290 family small acid-soluble spore protein [Clostridioides mangenotii]